ncbi:MAG: efflux RND transporter periplasmic adaptor subunit [Myxococcaceae bacterium]|nr:efflux RND transporter periplasmic adaptor subunit [Myxococcaceae bacterium]
MSRRRRASRGWATVVGVALLIAAAVGVSRASRAVDSRRPVVGASSGPVAASAPESRPVEGAFVGVVLAREVVNVAPRVAGRLRAMPVEVGDRVSRGDVIAQLDDHELRRDLALAEAALEGALAARVRSRAELGEAQQRRERRRSATTGIAAEELSAAEHAERVGDANVKAAEATVSERRVQVGKLRAALDEATLRAPFAGTVASRSASPGSLVAAGAQVVRLVGVGAPFVRFAVPIEVGHALRGGARVTVEVEAVGASFEANVENVAPEVEPGSQLIVVEAAPSERAPPWPTVASGMVARVRLAGPSPRPTDLDTTAARERRP